MSKNQDLLDKNSLFAFTCIALVKCTKGANFDALKTTIA